MNARSFRRIAAHFSIVVLSGMSADAAEIVLRPQAQPAGPIVRLGDVAEVRCEDLAEQVRLSALELFPTPAAGTRRWLRVRELQELLALRSEDMNAHQLRGAARVSIVAATPELHEQTSGKDPPAAAETLHIVARRDLLRGDVLRESDLEARPVGSLRRAARDPVTSLQDAVGQQLLRAVAAGQPLDYGSLRRPLWVERGRVVHVFVRVGAVRVATTGRALDQGARDDLVTVDLVDSRKRVVGRVVGVDQVEVAPQGVSLAGLSELDDPR